MKLMMGRGVSRNVAREITKTLRELKETEDLQKHYSKIGEQVRADCLEWVFKSKMARMYRWRVMAYWMEQRYSEKKQAEIYII